MSLANILNRSRSHTNRKRPKPRTSSRRRSQFERLEQRQVLSADWLVSFGNLGKDTVNAGVEVDAADNVFIAGDYTGTIDLAPGQSIPGDTLTSAGSSQDAYLAKYDSSGQLIWAKSFGGDLFDRSWGVAVDDEGNSFISGIFTGTADLDPGVGIVERTAAGQNDGFVTKLDPDGNFLWTQTVAGESDDAFVSVHTDTLGDVYLETDSNSLTTMHGPFSDTGNGTFARFISKLDGATGDFQWVREFRTDEGIGGAAIGVSLDGDLISVAGGFRGSLDVGGGLPLLQTASGDSDGFVVLLDSQTGATTNATSFSGPGKAENWANVFDADGTLLLTGQFEGRIEFGPTAGSPGSSNTFTATVSADGVSRSDAYVVRLDANLDVLATHQFGGPGYETPWATNSLVISPDGQEILVGGQFEGTVDTGAGVLASSGQMDGYLLVLDAALSPQWAERMGGAGDSGSGLDDSDNFTFLSTIRDDVSDDGVSGVAYDSVGNILVTGDFKRTATFSTGDMAASNGDADVFLMKLDRSVPRVSGNLFADFDGDGLRNGDSVRSDRFREGILASDGWAVELVDSNGTVIDTATPQGNSGNYTFGALDVPTGVYTVRPVLPAGWTVTNPVGGHEVTLDAGIAPLRLDFGATITTTEQVFASADVGQTIRNKPVESTLTVSENISIFDVDVELDISHTYNSDLEVFLVAPDGTEVELFTRVGGSGDGFFGVILDDDVAPLITQADSPISGSFKPEGDLQTLVGQSAQGDWKLRINDVARGDNGQFNSWSLEIFGATPPPPAPTLSVNDVSVVEGDSGTVTADFVVTRSGDDSQRVSVDVFTTDGTATAGDDYAAVPLTTLTFDPGVTQLAVSVPINGDPTDEADETLFVNLTNAVGAEITDPQGVGTILNDDAPASASAIYVWDIQDTLETRQRGRKNTDYRLVIDVRQDSDGVAEASDAGISGVAVTVVLTNSSGQSQTLTGLTDSQGIFRSDWIKDLEPDTYRAEVTNLALDGFEWDPFMSLDPTGNDEDADGDGRPDEAWQFV